MSNRVHTIDSAAFYVLLIFFSFSNKI